MSLVYNCCFWFSLRLGGILIGLFSLFQGILVLSGSCIAYAKSEQITYEFREWINNNNLNLIYFKDYYENLMQGPKKYISLIIGFTCIYMITCMAYIYGAYLCSNKLMYSFIIMELLRLLSISATIATGLLLLKQNTMDIGFLIGASIFAGFFLLGMFYLWICAANLPVLINEMERDEQAATIAKLQQLLETNQKQIRSDGYSRFRASDDQIARGAFTISNRTRGQLDKFSASRPKIAVS